MHGYAYVTLAQLVPDSKYPTPSPWYAQYVLNLPNIDTVIYTPAPRVEAPIQKSDSLKIARNTYHWVLHYDFFTTLSLFHFINSAQESELNHIFYYYNLDVKSNIKFRGLRYDFYLFTDYGARHYFDSTTIKAQDQLTLKNSIYYPIYKKKLCLSLTANTRTKVFNTYMYRLNALDQQERYLYDGFMSPGTIFYSGGLTYEMKGNSTIQLGLGSSKVTKIRNQNIFDTREVQKIQGIEKGTRKRKELGVTLNATVPMQHLSKTFHWEFFGNAFMPMDSLKKPRAYTLEVNNVFHATFLKYVRLSWRTKIDYNQLVAKKPSIQNQITLGFYLTNHL